MSYSTDPVFDADRHFCRLSAEQARQAEWEAYWAQERQIHTLRSTSEPAIWMPRDCWESEGGRRRPQTMAESMHEMLDYGDSATLAMDFIAAQARAGNAQALEIVRAMARDWATYCAPEFDGD